MNMPSRSRDYSAFEVEVSLNPSAPTIITDPTRALTYALVTRESLAGLDATWDAPGVYVLLGRIGQGLSDGNPIPEDEWQGYVGKAKGLRSRLRDHNRKKEFWVTAVLVRRDVSRGFNDAHISWLEHEIHDQLNTLDGIHLFNSNTPPGESGLNMADQQMVENTAEGVRYVLALTGYRGLPAGRKVKSEKQPVDKLQIDKTALAPSISPSRGKSHVLSLLEEGKLLPSETLFFVSNGEEGLVTEGGDIYYDGKLYSSLSAAGTAASKGWKSSNGKRDWGVQREGKLIRIADL